MQEINKKRFSWPLFLSPFISRLGDGLYIFGLNWFIVKATGAAAQLGIVQGIGGLVLVLGDLFAGPLVDNYNRKWVMILSDLISAIACLILALLIDIRHPVFYQLILLTSILDIGLAFNFPAAKAIIPELIKQSNLTRFNAWINTAFNFADIFAPLLGGVLLTFKWLNFRAFLVINAGSFLLSLFLGLMLRYHFRGSQHKQLSILTSLRDGINYCLQHTVLVQMIVVDGLLNIFYAALNLLMPYEVNHYFGGNEKLYSYALSLMAIGGLVGGLSLAGQKRVLHMNSVYRDVITFSCLLILSGLFVHYWVLLAAATVYGFFMSRLGVQMITLVQNETSVNYLGRVFAIWFLSVDALHPVGNFIFGFIIDWLKHQIFSLIGGLMLLLLLLVRRAFHVKQKKSR
ncbi:MFS transporter permease [Loigolactobacillus backii]|uniref:MFS transporter n=1 Tax=Loigolactobacillus backii TaxID=375175 RepID=UPI0007F0D363|nr:MFS transporter [Loigolactobacillus backii]ANK60638.1 MFS transporter permease [Loigolactobacillus backii]ANK65591.1 MFS transporter permease [Loigolactobacillus backii]ANK68063.1 MFS transporter permease [Loigolactobacillus backii]PIO86721.1 MFS transporter [Loigolactobacillus backii]